MFLLASSLSSVCPGVLLCAVYSLMLCFLFFNDTSTTEIYTYLHTLSLHDALPIYLAEKIVVGQRRVECLLLVGVAKAERQVHPIGDLEDIVGEEGEVAALLLEQIVRHGIVERQRRQAEPGSQRRADRVITAERYARRQAAQKRSEEHTSELPSLMRTSYAVFC